MERGGGKRGGREEGELWVGVGRGLGLRGQIAMGHGGGMGEAGSDKQIPTFQAGEEQTEIN